MGRSPDRRSPWGCHAFDYAREVKPRQGFAIHDAMLSEQGLAGLANWLKLAGEPVGARFGRLEPGRSVEL